jgi:hypothetical protein
MATQIRPWVTREDYHALREILDDKADLPDTYDEWFNLASKQVADLEARDIVVEKVIVNPHDFARYCDRAELDRNHATLGAFAVTEAARQKK